MKILWTDGSADPNPGPGGWAVIEQIGDDLRPVRIGSEKDSTNIRMEGIALINAIEYASDEECEIHTDSEFWINVVTKWAPSWKRNNWTKKSGPIKNLDIVQKLYDLYYRSDTKLIWTRGHVGTKGNELADTWASRARRGHKLTQQ
ncbi:ribonuclease HI [Candidatus Saccharibacteria bacterium]|nr:ribonuclease HI [Candidatus Saccharibacteria bacterium]